MGFKRYPIKKLFQLDRKRADKLKKLSEEMKEPEASILRKLIDKAKTKTE